MKVLLSVIIVIFTFLICLGLYLFRSYLGIEDFFSLSIYIGSILLILFVFLLCVPLFIKVQWITLLEKLYIKKDTVKAKKNKNDQFKILRHKIKTSKKIIVGIIGNRDIIDLSFPNLTQKLYLEDHDYLYVLADMADRKWLNFRGLGKRVFDSVLYITNPSLLSKDDFYGITAFIENIGMIISVNIACIIDSSFNHDAVCYSYKLNHKAFKDQKRLKNDVEDLISDLKCAAVYEIENNSNYSYISGFVSYFSENVDDFCKNLFDFVKKSKIKNSISRITFIGGGIYNNNIKGSFISPNTIYKKNANSLYDYCYLLLLILACCWVWIGYLTIKNATNEYKNIEEKLYITEYSEMDEIIKNYNMISNIDELDSFMFKIKSLPFFFYSKVLDDQRAKLYNQYVVVPFYKSTGTLLESEIESLTLLKKFSDENKKDLYNLLKLYLIFAKNKENDEITFVKENLLKLLAEYQPEDVMRVIDKSLASNEKNVFGLDNRIVTNSRNILINQNSSLLDVDKYYDNLKEEAQKRYLPLNLSSLLKNDVGLVWDNIQPLDGIYTKEAWKNFFKVKFNELEKQLSKSLDWVLIDLDDQEDSSLVKKLKNKYFEEYIDNWLVFLNSINWNSSSSINESIAQINKYTSRNNSCLIGLLKAIATNTDLRELKNTLQPNSLKLPSKFKSLENKLDNLNNELNIDDYSAEYEDSPADENLLYKTFEPLSILLNDSVAEHKGSEMSYDYSFNIRQYIEKIVFLKRRMYLLSSGNASKDAINYVLSSYNSANNNEFTNGLSFAILLEEQIGDDFIPFSEAVFKSIFENAWNNITVPAKMHLNNLWFQQVYKVWKDDLSQKYPFTESENEASYGLIKKFFNPNKGIFYSFLNKYLRSFVDLSEDEFTYNNDQTINFIPAFYQSFDYCNTISKISYLNADGAINFELLPLGGSGISESELSIDGLKIKYFNQVSSWKRLSWPQNNTEKNTKLTWVQESTGLSHQRVFTGDWSFIRFLETAQVEQIDENLYLLTFSLDDHLNIQYQLKTEYLSGPLEFLKAKSFNIPKKIVE